MNESTTSWEVRSLASLGTYLNGFAFKPQHWGEEGLPIVRIRELLDQTVEPDRYNGPLAQAFKIEDGDLIFSWSATLAALFWDRGPAYLNQHLFKVTAARDVDVRFLNHLINFHLDQLSARSHGTTMKHVTRGDLEAYMVQLPTIAEQGRIAEILDRLDDHIRGTEQIIEKLKIEGDGLISQLLTRGVDSDGLIRDPSARPKEFTETRIGTLPHAWTITSVGEVFDVQSGITLGPHRRPKKDSCGYLRVANVQRSAIDLSDVARLQASVAERYQYALRENDLLVVEGHADVGQIGRCARVGSDAAGLLHQNHLFRIRSSEFSSVFAEAWLNSDYAKSYWRRTCSTSSGLNTINSRQLKSMVVALPSLAEQSRIAVVLTAQRVREDSERRLLGTLRALKQGLMSDLLTGRVRAALEAAS